MMEEFNVLEIRVGSLFVSSRARDDLVEDAECLRKVIAAMALDEKESLEKLLTNIYKKFGKQSMFDFWERVLGLGFGSCSERLLDFAKEFYKRTAQSINDNRLEIETYQAKERQATKRTLF